LYPAKTLSRLEHLIDAAGERRLGMVQLGMKISKQGPKVMSPMIVLHQADFDFEAMVEQEYRYGGRLGF